MRLFSLIFLTFLLMGTNAMAITVNIYYTGENGNARKFAEEMEQSGTVALIRAEEGNKRYRLNQAIFFDIFLTSKFLIDCFDYNYVF